MTETLENHLPRVARAAILAWFEDKAPPAWPTEPALPVFVTLRSPGGELRGCIGSFTASEPDLARETARSAVLAATRDPRYPPMEPEEVRNATVEVTVLSLEEPVSGLAELDPQQYGVVVSDAHGRRGILLPEMPGVEDPATQVDIARRKAGIPPGEPVALRRFRVRKWVDPR